MPSVEGFSVWRRNIERLDLILQEAELLRIVRGMPITSVEHVGVDS